MKKKITLIALALILIATAATSTLAYFNSEDTAHNVITTSGVDIEIFEWQDENMTIPYPDEPVEIMPGATVDKVVTVKNNEADSWIRATVDITITDGNGKKMALTDAELAKVIDVKFGEKWTKKDGWYYYNASVKTGDTTAPLFSTVHFDGPNMGNEFQGATFEVIVNAQAVQSANNGATALDAAGWE